MENTQWAEGGCSREVLGEGVPEEVIWGQETCGQNKASHRKRLEREQAWALYKCEGGKHLEGAKNHPKWLKPRGQRRSDMG